MRKLHPVGFTSDLDGLIFSTRKGSKSGSFVVSIGEDLMDKLREAERLRNGASAGGAPHSDWSADDRDREWDRDRDRRQGRPESALTPREIQARLRAGRSIEEVAREAAVGREWVERFAAPIMAEQGKVIEMAQSVRFVKSRLGESSASLGESVALNLLDRGVRLLAEEFEKGWSAYQLHDRIWSVRFLYRSRGRPQQATWELDLGERSVSARDRLASDLGYLPASRRKAGGRGADNGEDDLPAAPPAAKVADAPAARVVAPPPARSTSRGEAAAAAKKAAARKATAKARAVKPSRAVKPTRAAKPARPAAKAKSAPRTAPRTTPRTPKSAAKKIVAAPKRVTAAAKPSRPATKKATAKAKAAGPTRGRASPPRIGTDGSRLANPPPQPARRARVATNAAPAAAPTPARRAATPTTPARPPAPTPAPVPASARRPADAGEREPPRRFDTNPRPSTPRAAAIVERLSALRRPSAGIPSPFAPRDASPGSAPPREPAKPEDDAFVIRPRISAKQASELASPGS